MEHMLNVSIDTAFCTSQKMQNISQPQNKEHHQEKVSDPKISPNTTDLKLSALHPLTKAHHPSAMHSFREVAASTGVPRKGSENKCSEQI